MSPRAREGMMGPMLEATGIADVAAQASAPLPTMTIAREEFERLERLQGELKFAYTQNRLGRSGRARGPTGLPPQERSPQRRAVRQALQRIG
jgi:hypothetical protein